MRERDRESSSSSTHSNVSVFVPDEQFSNGTKQKYSQYELIYN